MLAEFVARLGREAGAGIGVLLSEFAQALRTAVKLRESALEEPFARSARSNRSYLHPGFGACDQEVRRAVLLLGRVFEMANKSRLPVEEPDEELSPLDELDEQTMFDPDPVVDARIHKERRERRRELSQRRKPQPNRRASQMSEGENSERRR